MKSTPKMLIDNPKAEIDSLILPLTNAQIGPKPHTSSSLQKIVFTALPPAPASFAVNSAPRSMLFSKQPQQPGQENSDAQTIFSTLQLQSRQSKSPK